MKHLELAWIALLATTASAQDPIARVSDSPDGTQGNWNTVDVSISADGNYIAFASFSSNLVPNDNNRWANGAGGDIFVRNRVTGAIVRVSVSSAGAEANEDCYAPALSADGRFVQFRSFADNLVPNDMNGVPDIFVHDRDPDGNGIFDEGNGLTRRVSIASDGTESNSDNYGASISADGTLACFFSAGTNLVANDQNGTYDVFVHDLATQTTLRVSVDSNGAEGDGASFGSISADGRYVVFDSVATNLVANDTNGVGDVFLHDRWTGATTLVSLGSNGVQGDGPSASGRLTADSAILGFVSDASNLVAGDTNGGSDVFLRDLSTGITTRASVGTGGIECADFSIFNGMSADARFVVFTTSADNMVANDDNEVADVFVHDRLLGTTTLVSCSRTGEIGNDNLSLNGGGSSGGPISADGRFVTMLSYATNLVSNDTNDWPDAFLRDLSINIDASWSNYGTGFPGTLGTPTLTASADPVFGSTISLDVGSSSDVPTLALLLVGFAPASIPTSAGGTILVDSVLTLPFTLAPTGASFVETIPYDDVLYGQSAYLQVLMIDSGALKRIAFTPGLDLVLGR